VSGFRGNFPLASHFLGRAGFGQDKKSTRKWKRLEKDEQENFSESTVPTMHDIQSGKGEQGSTIA